MKRILIISICFLGLRHMAWTQYLPNSSQAFQYATLYNPAFAGIEPYGDLKIGYRQQWVGFGANSPRSANVVYVGRLNQPLDRRHNAMRTSTWGIQNKPWRKLITHGFGINLFSEEVGPVQRGGNGISYSVHMPVTSKVHLATGASLAIQKTGINMSEIYLGSNADPDPLFENLLRDGASSTDLNARAGVLFYTPTAFLGLSYMQLWNKSLQESGVDISGELYRGTIQAGLTIPLSPSFDIRPSILALVRMDKAIETDYNIKLLMRNILWFGLSYGDVGSMSGLLGFEISRLLMAAYTYEISTNGLKQFNDGSHEFVLSFRLNNSREKVGTIW